MNPMESFWVQPKTNPNLHRLGPDLAFPTTQTSIELVNYNRLNLNCLNK